jgi:hypothetical protein
MWEASPPTGLRKGFVCPSQPGPMNTSSSSLPLSSRIVRHRFPSAFSVNFTVVPPEPTVLPSPSAVAPALPVPEVDRLPVPPEFRIAVETSALVAGDAVDVPAAVELPDPEGAEVCGAADGVDEPVGFAGWPVDWVTEVEPAVVGEVVPLVGVVTDDVGAGAGATVVVVAATA